MDPYLEGPLWTSVHSQLAVEIARQLTPRLVPRYAALTERRMVMALPEVEDGVAVDCSAPVTLPVSRLSPGNAIDRDPAAA